MEDIEPFEEQIKESGKTLLNCVNDLIRKIRESNPNILLTEDGVPSEKTLRDLKEKYGIVEADDPTKRDRDDTMLRDSSPNESRKTPGCKLNHLFKQ